jgi:hypothetical protein
MNDGCLDGPRTFQNDQEAAMKTSLYVVPAMLSLLLSAGLTAAAETPSSESTAPSAVKAAEPELWTPYMAWVDEKGGKRTLLSVTYTPNSCFREAGSKPGFPSRKTGTPESLAVRLHFKTVKAGPCAQVVTPVYHVVRWINTAGKTTIDAYAILGHDIKGSNAAPVPIGTPGLPTRGEVPIPIVKRDAP